MSLIEIRDEAGASVDDGRHDIRAKQDWDKRIQFVPAAGARFTLTLWQRDSVETDFWQVAGHLVRAVRKESADAPLVVELRFPTPMPASASPFGQDLVIHLVRERFDGGWQQRIPSGQWLEPSGAPASGPVGNWTYLPTELHGVRRTKDFHFPAGQDGLGVFAGPDEQLPWMLRTLGASDFYAQMGILVVDHGVTQELVLAFAPRGLADPKSVQRSPGLLGNPDLVFATDASHGTRVQLVQAPLVLACPLAADARTEAGRWTVFVQWRAMRNGAASQDLRNAPLLFGAVVDQFWNRTVDALSPRQRKIERALSWLPLPRISLADGGAAYTLVTLERDPAGGATRATQIGAAVSSGDPDVVLDLAALGLRLHGRLAAVALPSWHDSLRLDTLPVEKITPQDVGALWRQRRAADDPTLLADWRIAVDKVVATQATTVLGTLAFRFPDRGRTAQCQLRGAWQTGTPAVPDPDLYPEFMLELACEFRPSGARDPGAEELAAQFDTAGADEDALQRDSGALVEAGDGGWREGSLTLRYKAQPGRDALIEMVLYSASGQRQVGAPSLYLHLRPFFVARMLPAVLDPQAGSRIAEWRSDDREGPQWRLADATVELELPPQAVGEEMERGARFWSGATSYIASDRPLRYRFAPPTRLVLAPAAERDRRYNVSPFNLHDVLRFAKVRQFTTEIVYPVRTTFQVDAAGAPDIRIAESARFMGAPPPNLPLADATFDERSTLLRKLYESALADWARARFAHDPGARAGFLDGYRLLRQRQSAVRMNFAGRLAEHHLHDPWRRDGKLMLRAGLASVLRGTAMGAPPLLREVLPRGVDLSDAAMATARPFLDAFGKWGQVDAGALRAGVLYTTEFSAELLALLAAPQATATEIDGLSFTALGANGHVSVSFDEGRTTFTADVRHGQLMRLVKTRIGRLALLWNKAKHVVIYQRDVVPSEQFEEEQAADPKRGWPILRKWEEFIEPLEQVRQFDADSQQGSNVTGFVEGAEFVTPRIYVNGAWGRSLGHADRPFGYEIPLWNPDDRSGFYPKPTIALRVFATPAAVNRLPCKKPEHLYFYSNTETGTGSDPDGWEAKPDVDGAPSFSRLPATTRLPAGIDAYLADTLPAPRAGGLHRPRFDLDVEALAPADLLHKRGTERMLVKPEVVSLSRTQRQGAHSVTDTERLLALPLRLTNKAAQVDAVAAMARRLLERLPALALDAHLDCDTIRRRMRAMLDRGFADLSDAMQALPAARIDAQTLRDVAAGAWAQLEQQLRRQVDAALSAPVRALPALRKSTLDAIEDALRLPLAELAARRRSVATETVALLQALRDIARRAGDDARRLLDAGLAAALHAFGMPVEDALAKLDAVVAGFSTWDIQSAPFERLRAEAFERIDAARAGLERARTAMAGALAGPLASAPGFARPAILPVLVILDQAHTLAQDLEQRLGTTRDEVAQLTDPAQLPALRQLLEQRFTGAANLLARAIAGLARDAGAALSAVAGFALHVATPVEDAVRAAGATAADLLAQLDVHARAITGAADQGAAELAAALGRAKADLASGAGAIGMALDTLLAAWVQAIGAPIDAARGALEGAFAALSTVAIEGAMAGNLFLETLDIAGQRHAVADWMARHYREAARCIDEFDCDAAQQFAASVGAAIGALAGAVEERVTGVITGALDDATRHSFAELAADAGAAAEQLGSGLKLVKAIGDLPSLPTLTFNAARAEYVFDDLKNDIETSPFMARLREIGDGLQGLGLSLPSHRIVDQIVPEILEGCAFPRIFNKLAGFDFAGFFERFRLPAIGSNEIKLTHGADAASRTAWVKCSVYKKFAGGNELLNLGSLAIKMNDLLVDARSDLRIGGDGGERRADTDARMTADWDLEFAGTRLARFRQVTVSFDGGGFGFDVAPANIELHPALKFVSEFARRFANSIPPAIEIERDARGMPVGARSNITTVVTNLPPLGGVTIGPLRIAAGLGLRVSQQGAFVVSSNVSVGSRAMPVFVQVGYLGGGMWLEARADAAPGGVSFEASVGLALGSTQAINFAGIARGHYAILLFASASLSNRGGSFRAGLSFDGCARILGVCNASLHLLLEAVHQDGRTEGRGELHVEVKICWCYTLKVHRAVTQNI